VLEALALKSTFAVRALAAGEGVGRSLAAGELEQARTSLRDLVNRPLVTDVRPCRRGRDQSLAENATDSVLAPWIAYAVRGLPAAAAYRA
jgi:adenosylcobinamide-phosphate synthase